MNKAAIIGIGIAIIVGIIGIAAFTMTQEEVPTEEAELGIGDEVGVTIGEEKGTEEIPSEEAELGLTDEAKVEVEEPEEEPEELEIKVEEKFGLGDESP